MPDFSTSENIGRVLPTHGEIQASGRSRLNVRIYGDCSGRWRHTVGSTGLHAYQPILSFPAGYSVTLHTGKANPAVKDRVNAVNAMLCNALGQHRTIISPTCVELIRDFKEVKWKRDSGGTQRARSPEWREMLLAGKLDISFPY